MNRSREENVFASYLHKKGLKLTPQRKAIIEEVFSIKDHFEAEDLLLRIREHGKRVSKGTIYRTLPLLTDCGLLREVIFVEKHSHYEHIYGQKHHEHLICLKCGQIIDFYNQELEAALAKVCRKKKFRAKAHKIEVTGYCENCRIP